MTTISEKQAQQLLQLNENKLLEQLGLRSVAAATASRDAPAIPSGPLVETEGISKDMKELGERILRRWTRVAYDLACGSNPDDASTRAELEQALHVSEAAAIGVLTSAFVAIGLSALVAPVLAALIIKKFFNPAYGEFCDYWKSKLSASAIQP